MQRYETMLLILDKDDQDLYQGTAKAAGSLAAERVFALAKQDADSTSEKAFKVHYPEKPEID